MKYPIYSIKDSKSGFQTPFYDINDESAKRGFAYALNQNGIMSFASKDYDLYKIGSFDTDTGNIKVFDLPELIYEGIDTFRKDDV